MMMLNNIGTTSIETDMCLLRRFDSDDAQAMYDNWCTDIKVTKYLSWEPHKDIDETQEILDEWVRLYDDPHSYRWAIVTNDKKTVIGSIDCVTLNKTHKRAEIGYCLSQKYWNKGIMTSALKAVIQYLFDEVSMHKITARHYALNPGSGRVMEKAGMEKEGYFKGYHIGKHGESLDMVQYGITKKDYQRQKNR